MKDKYMIKAWLIAGLALILPRTSWPALSMRKPANALP